MSLDKYVITLDSGTTSCRSMLIDYQGNIVASDQLEFTQYFPASGWVEHDAIEIWNTQLTTMQKIKQKANIFTQQIAALGITNQRETIVAWDKETGIPVYNAIVWQDRRTDAYCRELVKNNKAGFFQEKTGLVIDPYFSGTKIKWILENVPAAKVSLDRGSLLVGTIDTWLIWKLTKGEVHATDVSNASRTMLFNIHTLEWDQEILDLLNIPKSILPEVKPSSTIYGHVCPEWFNSKTKTLVPIGGVIGDQQAALFGSLCHEVGMVKNTYGTGCFCLMNTGKEIIKSNNNLLATIAWQIEGEPTIYALEGSVFIAGAAIQWLRDGLRLIYNAAECDLFISLIEKEEDVYMVPSFTGLGAPHWDSSSRGAIFGIERSTKREHIVKAALDSIGYQTNDLITAMEKDANTKIKVIKVDGGVSKSKYLMQFQADISRIEIQQLTNTEITALGASFLAGLAVKYWSSMDELKNVNAVKHSYLPQMDEVKVAKLKANWHKAVQRTLGWKD